MLPRGPAMDYSTGKLSFIFLAGVALAVLGAWLLAWRFRARMKALMSAPVPAAAPAPVRQPDPSPGAPRPLRAADSRRADLRLALLLVGLSALISLSSAALQLRLMGADMLTPGRWLTVSFVHLWPAIPALGLMWRWSRLRVLAVLAGWFLLCLAVVWWRSLPSQPFAGLLLYLVSEIGPAMTLVALLCMGNATRAIAPWLLAPLAGLVWASVAGVDLLALAVERRAPWLVALTETLGAYPVMALAVVLPWLLAWWPLKALARALAAAHARQWLSELMVLFTALWGVSLLINALGAASDHGLGGALMLLPLAWIPLVMALWRRLPGAPGRPPMLLVLRVFQRDRAMRRLFDEVVERWRLCGNTCLIAGTDLIERTLDAGDIFSFIDGRLAERFIRRVDEIPARLAAFELRPDAELRARRAGARAAAGARGAADRRADRPRHRRGRGRRGAARALRVAGRLAHRCAQAARGAGRAVHRRLIRRSAAHAASGGWPESAAAPMIVAPRRCWGRS
jgi:hypothetical protein